MKAVIRVTRVGQSDTGPLFATDVAQSRGRRNNPWVHPGRRAPALA